LASFEGIRAYKLTHGASGVFRLREHVDRLFASAKILGIEIPFSKDTIAQACIDTLVVNKLPEAYLRPIAFIGYGAMGLFAIDNPIRVAIAAWPWGAYLGEEGLRKGIRARVSSYIRNHHNAVMPKGKVSGHYVNSVMAKREAMRDGYQEAILLDADGYVSEASGENVFMVYQGTVMTPEFGGPILGGITRDTIIQLLRDMAVPVVEQRFTRDMLYIADEVFLTGTAAEVTPVREIDGRGIGRGEAGPITREVQDRYFKVIRGENAQHSEWIATYQA
jgi:branched-chain amino acid aminotransferase